MEILWTPPVSADEARERQHPLDGMYLAQQRANEASSYAAGLTICTAALRTAKEQLAELSLREIHTEQLDLLDDEQANSPLTVYQVGLKGSIYRPLLALEQQKNGNYQYILALDIRAERIFQSFAPSNSTSNIGIETPPFGRTSLMAIFYAAFS